MSEKTAVYPGTFDPITLGHLDVIKRGLKIFDKIIVAVTDNPNKKPLFSVQERKEMIQNAAKGLDIEVDSFKGLLVDYVRAKKCSVILRGMRELSDFEFEFQQATVNRQLSPQTETVFIVTSAEYFYLSSSTVKEIAKLKGSVSGFVPEGVEKRLKKKLA
ncbi:MAG: pantetheine-phosphate adenylyltransferase [Candidatus Diapherotrites archaeon]|nr:pantetheine-phosphate adenylyltransferase [Candidatus Diapherotrites archaeon]